MKTTRLAAFPAVCALAATGSAAAVCAPAGQAAATAGAGSILYVKGGKLWIASPDGRVKRRVPHTGSFEWPSQAENGTIVAQRGIYFHRLNRRGKELNRPITTAYRKNPILPAYNGPFAPEVSPDGTKIAYTYSFVASHFDPACNCHRVSPSMNTSPTWSPDGKSLAWADKRGIWVGRVGDISGQTCQLTKKLVVPGGSSPDWGPAKP